MRFYIFSFILHIIFIFCVINFKIREDEEKPKNVVVYLSELQIDGKGEPAPLKNLETQKIKDVKNIEKIKNKKETKKIEKTNKIIKNKDIKENKTYKKIENKIRNPLDGLVKDGTGTYIGDEKISQGIGYKIIREVDPIYPEMAKKINFKDEVIIQTKFLVGLNGKIEEIIFLDNFTKYGFHKEVEKALKKWEFEPIIYHGKNIKMYFYKDFRFNVK